MTHLTHSNETVPMKTTDYTYQAEYSPLEKVGSLLGIPIPLQYQKDFMNNNEYYGTSRINPDGWKFHYDRSEDIVKEPTKFNVEIDFYEQLESKKQKERDISSSN